MEDKEEAAEIEDLSLDGIHSGFFASDSPGEEIFLSLPELEE